MDPGYCNSTGLQCINTPGSYQCQCRAGFKADGDSCTGVLMPFFKKNFLLIYHQILMSAQLQLQIVAKILFVKIPRALFTVYAILAGQEVGTLVQVRGTACKVSTC